MKGEEHILVNFPIDTYLKKKAHSALAMTMFVFLIWRNCQIYVESLLVFIIQVHWLRLFSGAQKRVHT